MFILRKFFKDEKKIYHAPKLSGPPRNALKFRRLSCSKFNLKSRKNFFFNIPKMVFGILLYPKSINGG